MSEGIVMMHLLQIEGLLKEFFLNGNVMTEVETVITSIKAIINQYEASKNEQSTSQAKSSTAES